MMGRIIVKDNLRKYTNTSINLLDGALDRMAKDIKQVAQSRVPFLSGDLFSSAYINSKKLAKQIGFNKKYAAYQERGMRADGTRVVRRYTTPNTGKHYLRKAVVQTKKNALNYLKQAATKAKYSVV